MSGSLVSRISTSTLVRVPPPTPKIPVALMTLMAGEDGFVPYLPSKKRYGMGGGCAEAMPQMLAVRQTSPWKPDARNMAMG